MANVKQVQLTANMLYDDGYVVTISTPIWVKDIRHGDAFSDEQLEEIMCAGGEGMAQLIHETTAAQFHREAKAAMSEKIMPGPKPSVN